MASKHTPGPWETGALMTRVEVLPAGWRMPACVADCDAKHAPGTQEERVANARLIAASPTMYAALLEVKRLRDLWRSQEDDAIDSVAYMDGLDRIDVDAILRTIA